MTDKHNPNSVSELINGTLPEPQTLKAVKCSRCETLHDVSGNTYLMISGNITVGVGGGLVGNNLKNMSVVDEDTVISRPVVSNVTVFCTGDASRPSCLEIYLTQCRERIPPRGRK